MKLVRMKETEHLTIDVNLEDGLFHVSHKNYGLIIRPYKEYTSAKTTMDILNKKSLVHSPLKLFFRPVGDQLYYDTYIWDVEDSGYIMYTYKEKSSIQRTSSSPFYTRSASKTIEQIIQGQNKIREMRTYIRGLVTSIEPEKLGRTKIRHLIKAKLTNNSP